MYFKIGINILLIIFVSLLDIAFVSQLPFGLHRLHLLPIALIFVFLLGNIRVAAWWAIGGGLLVEFFSFGAFGWKIAGLITALAIIYILFEKVITNRSLYSVSAVTAAAVLSYDLILLWQDYSSGLLAVPFMQAIIGQLLGIVYTIVFALLVFYLTNTSSHRLHPAFLSKRSL